MTARGAGATAAQLVDAILRTGTPAAGVTPGITPVSLLKGVVSAVSTGPPVTVTTTIGPSAVQVPGVAVLSGLFPSVGDTVTIADLGQGDHLVIGAQAPASGGVWTPVTFAHGWVNYSGGIAPVGYRQQGSRVWLRGSMALGQLGQTAFTLPVAPPKVSYFPTIDSAGVVGTLTIATSGACTASGGSNIVVALDGISFDTVP